MRCILTLGKKPDWASEGIQLQETYVGLARLGARVEFRKDAASLLIGGELGT